MAAEACKVEPPFGPPDVEWRKTSPGAALIEGTIDCGVNDGQTIYAGRVCHYDELLIGTVSPDKGCVFGKDGAMHVFHKYEIMVVQCGDPLVWREVKEDAPLPKNLLKAGKSKSGLVLYVGRHVEDGNAHIGWIDPDRHCLHVAQGGTEKVYTGFDILVHEFLDRLVICPPCMRPHTCE